MLEGHGQGDGCETCKPMIASILASIWNEIILDDGRATLQVCPCAYVRARASNSCRLYVCLCVAVLCVYVSFIFVMCVCWSCRALRSTRRARVWNKIFLIGRILDNIVCIYPLVTTNSSVSTCMTTNSLGNPHPPIPPIKDTNDRSLANMQRGGTYSVVPRIPGGEIKPEGLVAIGKVQL